MFVIGMDYAKGNHIWGYVVGFSLSPTSQTKGKIQDWVDVGSKCNNHAMMVSRFHDMTWWYVTVSWYNDMTMLVSEMASSESEEPYFFNPLYLLRQYIY